MNWSHTTSSWADHDATPDITSNVTSPAPLHNVTTNTTSLLERDDMCDLRRYCHYLVSGTAIIGLNTMAVVDTFGNRSMSCPEVVSSSITPMVVLVPLTLAVVCPMYLAIIYLVRKQLRRVHHDQNHAPHPAVRNLPRVDPHRWDNETKVTIVVILIITCFCELFASSSISLP
ncbi:hypothetical protein ACOMHN_044294 [Nucella lapillus]